MAQTQFNQNLENTDRILCFHINESSQIQIIRLKNIPQLKYERVIFPGERLFFEAVPNAVLEIYSCKDGQKNLSSVQLCDRIRVNQESSTLKPSNQTSLGYICL
ncbi:DUF1830 domain-containing protein [Aerosakkonema funiforme]|uniref:DUF1830 domain-containing protein n=1 Tax=Aerosakkonema funiforme TaxID=1246630 RepID=UPI0035BB662B